MVFLVTCKNEEDPIKNEGTIVAKRLYVDFSDAQRQISPSSVVGFGKMRTHSSFYACPRYL